jgi:hypothetical protein
MPPRPDVPMADVDGLWREAIEDYRTAAYGDEDEDEDWRRSPGVYL